MSDVTAEALVAHIRFPCSQFVSDPPPAVFDHPVPQQKLPSDSISMDIATLGTAVPTWLARVEQRIRNSVEPAGKAVENEGQWLPSNIVEVALPFLREVAETFPCEPFIYSSNRGDLIAEFDASPYRMTMVITPKSVLIYAVRGAAAFDLTLDPSSPGLTLRQSIQGLIQRVRAGKYGDMDPGC